MTDREIHWRETWPEEDRPNDLCGYDGEVRIGRIYFGTLSGNRPAWFWFTAWGGRDNTGWVPSRREAALLLQDRYEAFLAGGGKVWWHRGAMEPNGA